MTTIAAAPSIITSSPEFSAIELPREHIPNASCRTTGIVTAADTIVYVERREPSEFNLEREKVRTVSLAGKRLGDISGSVFQLSIDDFIGFVSRLSGPLSSNSPEIENYFSNFGFCRDDLPSLNRRIKQIMEDVSFSEVRDEKWSATAEELLKAVKKYRAGFSTFISPFSSLAGTPVAVPGMPNAFLLTLNDRTVSRVYHQGSWYSINPADPKPGNSGMFTDESWLDFCRQSRNQNTIRIPGVAEITSKAGILFVNHPTFTSRLIATVPGEVVVPHPTDPSLICIPEKGMKRFNVLDLKATQMDSPAWREPIQLPVSGDVQSVRFSHSRSYCLVTTAGRAGLELQILTFPRLDLIHVQPIGRPGGDLDARGNLVYVDRDGFPRLAFTNAANIEKKLLVTPTSNGSSTTSAPSFSEVVSETSGTGRTLLESLEPILAAVTNSSELDAVKERVEKLRRLEYRDDPSALTPVDRKIADLSASFVRTVLSGRLIEAETVIGKIADVETFNAAVEHLETLDQWRQAVALPSSADRERYDAAHQGFLAAVAEKKRELSTVFDASFAEQLRLLGLSTEACRNRAELHLLRSDPTVAAFLSAAICFAEAADDERLRSIQRVFETRSNAIDAHNAERERKAGERIARVDNEIRELLDGVSAGAISADAIASGTTLAVQTDHLLAQLPPDLAGMRKAELARAAARSRTQAVPDRGVSSSGTVSIGSVELPAPAPWNPVVTPVLDRRNSPIGSARLLFRDSFGREFDPGLPAVPANLSDPDVSAAVNSLRPAAREYFRERTFEVPSPDPTWEVGSRVRGLLERTARYAKLQMAGSDTGIVIYEGDAGCGKNVLGEIFASQLDWRLVTIACHGKMTIEDLTESIRLVEGRGTVVEPSNLSVAVRLPYTVVFFDEINTLPVESAKALHPLFDYRRQLVRPTGAPLKAEKTTIFLGGMNFNHYVGVAPLAETIKDRSLVIPVGYPEASEELSILRHRISNLAELSSDEFGKLAAEAAKGNAPQVVREFGEVRVAGLNDLRRIIAVAGVCREAYRQSHSGGTDPFDFIFSLRVSRTLAGLSGTAPVADLMRDIILPKAEHEIERSRIATVISQVAS